MATATAERHSRYAAQGTIALSHARGRLRMIQRTIFYSWQSDTEQSVNRYLIRDALKAAAKRLSIPGEVDEATRGVAGSPPIFETILRIHTQVELLKATQDQPNPLKQLS